VTLDYFKPFVCKPGLVTTSDCDNGNMLGSTGLAWALLALKHVPLTRDEMRDVITPHQARPGLYMRHPDGSGGLQSADDYFGLIAGLALQSYTYPVRDILAYGRLHAWVFNSGAPGTFRLKAWFGRYPALIAHITYGSCQEPNLFLRTYWALSVFLCCMLPVSKQDSYIQTWCMVVVYERQPFWGWLQTTAAQFFRMRLLSLGGLERILSDYIGIPDHPLVRLAKEVNA